VPQNSDSSTGNKWPEKLCSSFSGELFALKLCEKVEGNCINVS